MKPKYLLYIVLVTVISILAAAPLGAQSGPHKGVEVVGVDNVSVRPGVVVEPKGAAGPAYYLVQLNGASLAAYQGGIAGLEATNPAARGEVKLDTKSAASAAYLQYLAGQQAQALSAIEQALGRTVSVLHSYQYAFNGFAIELTPAEAQTVAGLDGIKRLFRNQLYEPLTDAGPAWIGAPGVWDGSGTGLPGTEGEGVIAGVIDTGINDGHPSYADVGDDGYDHTNPFGAGVYVGWCDPANPNYDPTLECTDKLIGMWSYPDSGNDPRDDDGHGSHTSSTVAGNHIYSATLSAATITIERDISGVAPHANIIAYDACAGGCPSTALVASIDQAVADGVDVINYSISGGSNPYSDPQELAFLDARAAGVFVAASAGNSGPGALTTNHQGAWLTTVAASTHNRAFLNSLVDLTGGNTTPPADIEGRSITSGYGPAEILYAGDYGDPLCPIGAFAPGTFSGEIVICDRGTYARVDKGQAVLDGGGGGMVLVDNISGSVIGGMLSDPHVLPALHIPYDVGQDLIAWVQDGGASHTGTITGTTMDLNDVHGDIISAFSSRGPSSTLGDLIKPDVTAPGVDILAAYVDPEVYNVISGTSMSSPHTAGAGALMKALHPDWTPAEIQSALMSTGVTDVLKEDAITAADPFDMGAGRIDVSAAGSTGLVLDETYDNYLAADPNLGGDPKSLNTASVGDDACVQVCSWTRTVRSTLDTDSSWTALGSGGTGMVVTVDPSSFTIPAGGTQVLTVTVDVSGAAVGDWVFGEVNLIPEPTAASPQVVLYDNGPLINCAGCGVGGADESIVQTSLGLTIYGFGHQFSVGYRIADEFTITDPGGWQIDQITYYAYQTFSGNNSTITGVYYQIWDGSPDDPGSSVVFGDTTTNRLTSTGWSNIYRVNEAGSGTNTDRPVMADVASAGATLGPGTYWLDWMTAGSLSSGPWAPPITINGQTTTGNALQFTGAWAPALDSGTGTQQGFPFLIEGSVQGGGGELPAVHFPVAVVPATGEIPDSVNINTRRDAGSQVSGDLITIEVTDLTVDVYGLTEGTVTEELLSQDPTNGDPYDNLNDGTTFWITVPVAAGSPTLVAETVASTAIDMDLYVGQDLDADGPEASEQLCGSFSPIAIEYCAIEDPAAGDYWVLVQNWDESDNPPDSVTLVTVAIDPADNGNMTVEGPDSVPAGTPYNLTVYWDNPGGEALAMEAGDYWYAVMDVGTDPSTPGNIGRIPVTLARHEDDVTKAVDNAAPEVGDTLTYTITVQPNVTPADLTYWITDTIPAGLTYVPGSATASAGTVNVVGSEVTWTGVMAAPTRRYVIVTSNDDPVCAAPLANSGAYVDLSAFGIFADPSISGDTIDITFDYGGDPINFYGSDQSSTIHLTDDGFTFFDPSTPGGDPWVNQDIPDPAEPNNLQAAWWKDWEIVYDAGANRGVSLATLTSGGIPVAAIVEYDDIEPWPAGGTTDRFDFEVAMYTDYDDGPGAYEIIFAYDNLNGAIDYGTIGVENVDGTEASVYAYDDANLQTLTNGLAICFDWALPLTDAVTITYQATVEEEACETTVTNDVLHQTDNPGSQVAGTSVDVTVGECAPTDVTLSSFNGVQTPTALLPAVLAALLALLLAAGLVLRRRS
ncbi:MAG: S8 family serine peptidase [Chloroflexota bacterium]